MIFFSGGSFSCYVTSSETKLDSKFHCATYQVAFYVYPIICRAPQSFIIKLLDRNGPQPNSYSISSNLISKRASVITRL